MFRACRNPISAVQMSGSGMENTYELKNQLRVADTRKKNVTKHFLSCIFASQILTVNKHEQREANEALVNIAGPDFTSSAPQHFRRATRP